MPRPTKRDQDSAEVTVMRKNPDRMTKLVFLSEKQAQDFAKYRRSEGITKAMEAVHAMKFNKVKILEEVPLQGSLKEGEDGKRQANKSKKDEAAEPKKNRADGNKQKKPSTRRSKRLLDASKGDKEPKEKAAKTATENEEEGRKQQPENLTEEEKKKNLEMGYANGIRPEGQMRIFVQPYAENHGTLDTLTVSLYAAATVIELKAVIQARTGGRAQLEQQVLVTSSKPRLEMEDSKALQYYDIKEGSSVFLILKPPEPQAALEQRSQPANNTLQQYADLLHAEGALDRPRTEGATTQRRERVVRIRFSDAEVSSLIEAVMEKGVGSWQHILHDPKYGFDARKRSAVDLKVRMHGRLYLKSTNSLPLDHASVDNGSRSVLFHGTMPFFLL
uniref:Ubiquitin-like domain-containing protein n=1 Tax=Picocystis salinarum TaxID=88271 RepID=A0A7S3XAQ1_9CHLO|mmetsp:Transcript_3510/g.22044  ORF Transcript_3510/g.22044 Transcript_3510/m.22044 type:complete len:389 (+) Transcript_3510:126-1292(+)